MNEENKKPMLMKDAKSSLMDEVAIGISFFTLGLAFAAHAYWHGFNPQMLLIALFFIILGSYIYFKSKNKAIESYHEMTRAFFPGG